MRGDLNPCEGSQSKTSESVYVLECRTYVPTHIHPSCCLVVQAALSTLVAMRWVLGRNLLFLVPGRHVIQWCIPHWEVLHPLSDMRIF